MRLLVMNSKPGNIIRVSVKMLFAICPTKFFWPWMLRKLLNLLKLDSKAIRDILLEMVLLNY